MYLLFPIHTMNAQKNLKNNMAGDEFSQFSCHKSCTEVLLPIYKHKTFLLF